MQPIIQEQKPKCRKYTGIFENPSQLKDAIIKETKFEKKRDDKDRLFKIAFKEKQNEIKLKEEIMKWDPKNDPKYLGNPKRTIFIGGLDYEVDEKLLERQFKVYGKIEQLTIVRDFNNKSRGYAFITFDDRDAAEEAHKKMDNKQILNRQIFIDFERERVYKDFLPRKLGGMKGRFREHPANLKSGLSKIYEKYPDLKPGKLNDFRYDFIKMKEKKEKEREEIKNLKSRFEDSNVLLVSEKEEDSNAKDAYNYQKRENNTELRLVEEQLANKDPNKNLDILHIQSKNLNNILNTALKKVSEYNEIRTANEFFNNNIVNNSFHVQNMNNINENSNFKSNGKKNEIKDESAKYLKGKREQQDDDYFSLENEEKRKNLNYDSDEALENGEIPGVYKRKIVKEKN